MSRSKIKEQGLDTSVIQSHVCGNFKDHPEVGNIKVFSMGVIEPDSLSHYTIPSSPAIIQQLPKYLNGQNVYRFTVPKGTEKEGIGVGVDNFLKVLAFGHTNAEFFMLNPECKPSYIPRAENQENPSMLDILIPEQWIPDLWKKVQVAVPEVCSEVIGEKVQESKDDYPTGDDLSDSLSDSSSDSSSSSSSSEFEVESDTELEEYKSELDFYARRKFEGLDITLSEKQGPRQYQEDTILCGETSAGSTPQDFKRAFYETHQRTSWFENEGATCVVTVVTEDNKVRVANIGDSRAMYIIYNPQTGERSVERITKSEDKPEDLPERVRIGLLGGKVTKQKGTEERVPYRVNGVLSTAGSFGDARLMGQHPITQQPEYLISKEPHCYEEIDLQPFLNQGKEVFVVVGCDGLVERLKDAEVCDLLCDAVARGEGGDISSDNLAEMLSSAAIENGSRDNVSVGVIKLSQQHRSQDFMMGVFDGHGKKDAAGKAVSLAVKYSMASEFAVDQSLSAADKLFLLQQSQGNEHEFIGVLNGNHHLRDLLLLEFLKEKLGDFVWDVTSLPPGYSSCVPVSNDSGYFIENVSTENFIVTVAPNFSEKKFRRFLQEEHGDEGLLIKNVVPELDDDVDDDDVDDDDDDRQPENPVHPVHHMLLSVEDLLTPQLVTSMVAKVFPLEDIVRAAILQFVNTHKQYCFSERLLEDQLVMPLKDWVVKQPSGVFSIGTEAFNTKIHELFESLHQHHSKEEDQSDRLSPQSVAKEQKSDVEVGNQQHHSEKEDQSDYLPSSDHQLVVEEQKSDGERLKEDINTSKSIIPTDVKALLDSVEEVKNLSGSKKSALVELYAQSFMKNVRMVELEKARENRLTFMKSLLEDRHINTALFGEFDSLSREGLPLEQNFSHTSTFFCVPYDSRSATPKELIQSVVARTFATGGLVYYIPDSPEEQIRMFKEIGRQLIQLDCLYRDHGRKWNIREADFSPEQRHKIVEVVSGVASRFYDRTLNEELEIKERLLEHEGVIFDKFQVDTRTKLWIIDRFAHHIFHNYKGAMLGLEKGVKSLCQRIHDGFNKVSNNPFFKKRTDVWCISAPTEVLCIKSRPTKATDAQHYLSGLGAVLEYAFTVQPELDQVDAKKQSARDPSESKIP